MATDNAISTLGKIVEGPYADCTGMDANAVAGIWLGALPLTADHAEAQVCRCALCSSGGGGYPRGNGASFCPSDPPLHLPHTTCG